MYTIICSYKTYYAANFGMYNFKLCLYSLKT